MSKIWITSDTHYGHSGLVRGVSTYQDKSGCRDFDTLEEHDDTLVRNINDCARRDDFLYILGDFSMGGRENVALFRERLKCKNIYLCLGNHDYHIRKNIILRYKNRLINAQDLFVSVADIMEHRWWQTDFVMCHYPFFSWNNAGKSYSLYGHIHHEVGYNKRAICVAMDNHPEFRPYSLKEIKDIIHERI